MRIRVAVPEEHVKPDVIDAVLEGVTRLDEHMIRTGQSPTSRELIAQGAIWRPENPGDEHFDHGATIARRGWGDCDDWAPLHAATLRASGEDPGAVARVVPSGPLTYHAIVQRTNGQIDDPSIAAGMRPRQVSGVDGDTIRMWAHDPHDGRIYEGQLAPTVGPLALHAGPAIAVRGCDVAGAGPLYEARCDLPLTGSPLIEVHGHVPRRRPPRRGQAPHARHHHHHHHLHVVGAVPYALACTSLASSPLEALDGAIVGAILMADAAELSTTVDRYKLLAMQAALSGASPGQVHQMIEAHIHQDLAAHAAATGSDPEAHASALLEHAAAVHGAVVSTEIGSIFSKISHLAHEVVHSVSDVVNDVAHVVKAVPWGTIIHDVQAAVSVVPVLGTAVSDVLATAETAYDAAAAALSGDPLKAAIQAAYNYGLATLPGGGVIRGVLDPVVNVMINMTVGHEPIESAALDQVIHQVPDAPRIGHVSPRSLAASLGHLIVGKRGMKHTGQGRPVPGVVTARAPATAPGRPATRTPLRPTPVHPAAAAEAAPRRTVTMAAATAHPAAAKVATMAPAVATSTAVKPPGVPHAAVHTSDLPSVQHALPTRVSGPWRSPWVATPQPGGWRFGWGC